MEQELNTLLEHPSSPSHIVGFVLLNLCVVFCRSLFVLSSFFLTTVFSVRFLFTASDSPFLISVSENCGIADDHDVTDIRLGFRVTVTLAT
jgi:hypothetical protein